MKRVVFVLGLSLFAFACTNSEEADNMKGHKNEMASVDPNAKFDPVCDMTEGDIAWTDFSVQGTDTTWFCSGVCKEKFDKHPEKYIQE